MEREKATFITYQPYLSIGYMTLFNNPKINSGLKERAVQFDVEGRVTTDNPVAIQGLREFADRTKSQYIVAELVEGLDQQEFIKLHYEAEDRYLEQAEKRQQEAEAEQAKEDRKNDIYRLLSTRG